MQHTKSGTYFGVLQVSYDKTDPGCDIGQVTGLVSEVGRGRYLQTTMAALDIIVLLCTEEMNKLFKAVQQGKLPQILNCKLAVFFCIQNLSNLKLLGLDLLQSVVPVVFVFCKLPPIFGALSQFCNLDDFSRRLLIIVCGERRDIRMAASRYIKDCRR